MKLLPRKFQSRLKEKFPGEPERVNLNVWRREMPVDSLARSTPAALQRASQFHPPGKRKRWRIRGRLDEMKAKLLMARKSSQLFAKKCSIPPANDSPKIAQAEQDRRSLPSHEISILQVPDDVLANVLEFVFRALNRDSNISFELSHVCRKFRRVALSLSCFWTHISTDLSYNRCKELLARTRDLDQTLSLSCKSLCTSQKIFDLACQEVSRWESFFLLVGVANGVPSSNINLLSKLCEFSVPRLRRLTLAYVDPSDSGIEALDNSIHFYGQLRAPALDELGLMNIIPKRLPFGTVYSISKLTLLFDPGWRWPPNRIGRRLPSNSMRWRDVLDFLQDCKAVANLTLDLRIMDYFDVDDQMASTTVLPHVTTFSVRLEDIAYFQSRAPHLMCLTFPNLRVLDFQLVTLLKNYKRNPVIEYHPKKFEEDVFFKHLLRVNGECFEHVTSLFLRLEIRASNAKGGFQLPFHKFPDLELLHIQSNREIYPPNSHHLKVLPPFGLPLKNLELVNCSKLNNFAWMRRLGAYVDAEKIQNVVIITDDDFPSDQRLVEATKKVFGRQRIRFEEHVSKERIASSPFDSAFR